ncbi:orotidine-5'-phosphate decarboxylase [Luteimonas sp. FXH3W]|uniref:Orotidine 5'-phosphate decarboxylase n=1 Tax=Aquilutibacter rugosus TaxID=3115820 RepID=A0ABU7UXX2_9GAMM
MTFKDLLEARWRDADTMVCVGLDPELVKFPESLRALPAHDALLGFFKPIIDATAEFACAFKPQIAHFAALGAEAALVELIAYIRERHPAVPVILDSKRGDIGSTAGYYAVEAFERFNAHAVTVNPYLGSDGVEPFLAYADRGVIVLCRTSNPSAGDFQDLQVEGKPLYAHVAAKAARDWNHGGQCALVVGATWPQQLREVRELVGDAVPLLVPGVGAQGGNAADVVHNAASTNGYGLIINSSRAILYASNGEDFASAAGQAARTLRDEIRAARNSHA